MPATILLSFLILMLFGAFSIWQYSRNLRHDPTAGLGWVVVIVLILVVLGRI
jgi:predicted ABC-type exoprotein transport system permease subunit